MHLNQVFLVVTLIQSLTASDFASAANDHIHQASGTTNVKDAFAVAPERIDNFGESTTSTDVAASQEERLVPAVATGRTHAILPSVVAPSEPTEMTRRSAVTSSFGYIDAVAGNEARALSLVSI
uniref:Uncharacterized protein n=1 Tax=Peronospora matthiolae TaxID=2874970 RepID=A0AAV1TAU8_9STRA